MKKKCVGCGKQIPSVALDCVFCSAKQPMGDDAAPATEVGNVTVAGGADVAQPTRPLIGLPTAEMNAVVSANLAEDAAQPAPAATNGAAEPAGNGPVIPPSTKLTGMMAAIDLPLGPSGEAGGAERSGMIEEPEPVAPPMTDSPEPVSGQADVDTGKVPKLPAIEGRPFMGLARTVMGVGGVVLIALFFLPWHGVSSWQLLETLGGADFVRQLFYLTGGIVLFTSALLPLPFAFRAGVGAAVAATPVLLGAGGMIEGWRGVVAALAILGLPATHLLRANAKSSAAARALVMAAVAAVGILYLVPISSVVPIVGVFKMISSGEIGPVVMGIFILIPLVFAGLSLLGLMGRDLTDVGILLSVLSLLWAPLVVALRGLLMEDGTQLYVALALLWASATAALSLAQLLSLAAHDAHAA